MNKIIIATLAVFVLASCNKDKENESHGQGKEATLNVSIEAPKMSRAASTALPTDVVGNFSVFIVDNKGEIRPEWSRYSPLGQNLTNEDAITVTTVAEYVYIVANAGDLTTSITTLAALKGYLADLNGTGSQASAANRWATGQSEKLSFVPDGSGNYSTVANVTLKFIAARITVTVDNQMTNYGAAGSLTLNTMAVLSARGQSLLFPASGQSLIPAAYSPGKKFYTGFDEPTPGEFGPNWPATSDYTLSSDLLSDPLTNMATDTYYYYVFENDATALADLATIVTLIGKDDNGDWLSWPAHLAPYEQWASGSDAVTSIERGNSYNINMKLTGDATDGGGGTWPPTEPSISSTVVIEVQLQQWNPITLNKEF